jgi:hypothetical protein
VEDFKVIATKVNQQKYDVLSKLDGEQYNFLIKVLLSRIFESYESNPMNNFRVRALQVCEKII